MDNCLSVQRVSQRADRPGSRLSDLVEQGALNSHSTTRKLFEA